MKNIKNENLIIKLIKYAPSIFIIIIAILMAFYNYKHYSYHLKMQKTKIAKNYIQTNKDRIKIHIETVSNYTKNKTKTAEDLLKKDLKHKINTAYKIAINIYNKNKDILPKEEIIRHIKNAIEPLQFNEGRGYFSIHTMDGINILHPIFRELEGTSVLNRKDLVGNYPVQDAINIAKTKGEGFLSWYYYKPNDKSKQFKKFGIIKKFEPYDLIITTAIFHDVYKKKIEKEILEYLKEIRYKDNGYIFVINKSGDFLISKTKFSNISQLNKNNLFIKKFDEFINSKDKTTYLEYTFTNKKNNFFKISYLKKINFDNWIIATGFDLNKLNIIIKEKQEELEKDYNEHLSILIISTIILTIFLLILSLFISKLLEKIFYQYRKKLLEKERLKFESILEEFNTILDHLPMMMIYKDTQNNILRVNKSVGDFFNLNEKELKNIPTKDIFPNDYEKYYKHDLECINSKKAKVNFIETYHEEAKTKTLESTIIPILNKFDEVENIIVFILDITEKENLIYENEKKEKLLYQQNKMATMGEMIANIAHQWRQPLSTISIAATGSKLQKEMDCLTDKELKSALDIINNSVQYLSQTIDDFRNFFNPRNSKYTEFNISSPINKTLKLLLPKLKSQDIEIIEDIEDIKIMSLENELIQVLINIINNARDELIKYKHRKIIFIKTYQKEDNLIIEIKDNAKGIKSEIIEKIFDSYFTTKESTQGTGIGLYMSKDILTKLLHGIITVENEEFIYEEKHYLGAKFIIEIPLA